MTNIINLTPHSLTLRTNNGEDIVIPPSGTVARVSCKSGSLTEVEGIPIPVASVDAFGEVEGLPPPAPNTYYIVSALVGARVARSDVFTPGTGPNDGAVRNEKGHIIAVTRLKATV
jgi:hypothetical protein